MAQPFENLIAGRHNVVLLGEAGCGKSEIALNLATLMAGRGKPIFLTWTRQSRCTVPGTSGTL